MDDLLPVSAGQRGEQALLKLRTLWFAWKPLTRRYRPVAALVPRSEIEGDMGEAPPGSPLFDEQARLRKLTSSIKSPTLCCLHNQASRQKIGVVYGFSGNNHRRQRTQVLRHRFVWDIVVPGGIKQGDEILGNETRVKVVKNKVAPPFKQAEFEIIYGQGISREGEIIDIGTDMDIFNKSGAWYSYQGNKIGQGQSLLPENG